MATGTGGDIDYKALFEKTIGLYLVLSPDFEIVAVNDAYCRATMTVRDDIVGRSLFDVFPDNPDDPNASGANNLRLSLNRVLEYRQPDAMAIQKYDIRRPQSEGGGFEERYWSPRNIPVLDGQNRVRWIIHRVQDVTEALQLRAEGDVNDQVAREQRRLINQLRQTNEELAGKIDEVAQLGSDLKRKQKELARTQSFLDLIIENIPAMLFVKDAEQLRFVLLNRAGKELLGYGRDEVIGASDYDVFPTDEAESFIAQDREVLASGKLHLVPEEQITTRDKGIRLLQTRRMPVFDSEGKPAFLLGLSDDITDRKSQERQLQQAQKMEAVGQLTGGIAHDFNNLLTVILSNAEALAEELDQHPNLRALAEMTKTAAERGADLTNSLLAFARRQTLEPRAVDVNKLVAAMDGLLRRTLGEEIEIEFIRGAALWQATIDPVQLESALLNLCLNARDAMPNGGKLTVETGNAHIDDTYSETNDVAAGQYVLICVSDTGIGMTPDVIARAFDPFFSTKEVGKGTGLGLSMVYGFVKQSGGHVKIYSEVGHGTLFKIYLPRSLEQQTTPVVEPQRKPADPTGTETILIVEDDELVREHAQASLRGLGYQVLIASNGLQAVAILEQGHHIDLLFTDVVMPGMGGRQLADRAAALRPGLKILFTSGYTEDAIVHHGRLDPGVHLLRKPYRRRSLAVKVRQLLDADGQPKKA